MFATLVHFANTVSLQFEIYAKNGFFYTYFERKITTPISSVAEPEPQGAVSFGRSRSRNAMRLRLRQWY
jgi:hypothetical protein